MARVFEKLDEWSLFVPDVGNERAVYKENPDDALTVEIRYLTAREASKYDRIFSDVRTTDDVSRLAEESASRLFTENVRNVRNYAPNGESITTGEQLWHDGEVVVINAITAAIRDRMHLEDGLAKKLKPSSVGSDKIRATSISGSAPDATQALSQANQEIQKPKTQSSGSTIPKNEPSVIAMDRGRH